MRFKPTSGARRRDKHAYGGFTLAEVLAALVFMAIVIPVAVQGVRIATLAGQVGVRKEAAARVAERVLNELIVTGQFRQSAGSGTAAEGALDYQWSLRLDPWIENNIRLLTVRVTFPAQGQDYDVSLSTLVDTAQ